MRSALVAIVFLGCASVPSAPPEGEGLPLLFPPSPPPPAPPAPPLPLPPSLTGAACDAVRLQLADATRSVIAPEAYERTFAGVRGALHEAVCACPPRAPRAWLVVTSTPDRGALAARGYPPDAELDACLSARLSQVTVPRWHLGTDCVRCGPRYYGLLPHSPPPPPEDGVATLNLLVAAIR